MKRIVDQRCGLERLPRLLLRHPLGGQLAESDVDQRQQPAGRVRVALTQGIQELGHLIHQPQMILGPGKAR
jgi:hypothetical protein